MRIALLAVLLAPALAAAQVPAKLGYQGRLLKANGTPEIGVVQFSFALHAASTGGPALWTESQSLALADGFYATTLGEVTPLSAGAFDGSERFVEVSAAGNALPPRHKIASVPYALLASEARGVKGGAVDATSLTINGKQVVDASGKVEFGQLKACPGAGEILKWSGASWECAADAGGMATIVASAPLAGAGTSASPLSLNAASAAADGYLAKADYAAFTNKLSAVNAGAGLSGAGTAASALAIAFAGTGSASSASRSDHGHGEPAAGQNLLADSQAFSHVPTGLTNVTLDAAYGVWRYFKYDASKAEILVIDPPADLLAIVSPGGGGWWPRPFKVLHLKLSPGGTTAGRLIQALLASDKPGAVTTSAYIKVTSGTLYLGHENNWTGFASANNNTWKRVSSVATAPTRTLGGVYGFAGEGSVFTEAYIALPKVETGNTATPWSAADRDGNMNASQVLNAQPGALPLSGTFYTSTGNVLLLASGSGYTPAGAGRIGMNILVDGILRGQSKGFTNEGGSHKAFTPAFLVVRGLTPGAHTVQLTSWNATLTDLNDFFNVAAIDMPY